MIDEGVIMPLVIVILIVIVVMFVWKAIVSSRSKVQPITKNQYERLQSDSLTSARLNRNRNTKYIGVTGDSRIPGNPKYLKYVGDNIDARIPELWGKAHWYTPKRWIIVPFALLNNIGGKTLWIKCTGFKKDGYFLKPIIPRDMVIDGKTHEYWDSLLNEYIGILLSSQSYQDLGEQIYFEQLYSATHETRTREELMTKREYPEYYEQDRTTYSDEPEG